MCFSVETAKEIDRVMKLFKAKQDLEEVSRLNSMIIKANDFQWAKDSLGLSRKPSSNPFKLPGDDNRIFPGYFSQVMVQENENRIFKPMRYRVRPHGSKSEIPTKFNVFNARMDSLEVRQTWTPLFMKNHGLFPFVRFFEWVEDEGNKRLISFKSDQHEILWAPCLWDYWFNEKANIGFYSFAIITDDPPSEIAEMGHDRCPIFLGADKIDGWLSPEGKTKEEIYEILKTKEKVHYSYAWVA